MTDIAIEYAFPEIRRWESGNTGIPYAWTFAASRPGPHLLIQALTHGNEVCGAVVVDWLLRLGVRPQRGKLSLAFANVEAYHRFERSDPFGSRFVDEDFNRLWAPDVLDSTRRSSELVRGRALRPLYDQVDALLDIHSMLEDTTPLALAGPASKGLALARAIRYPEHVVVDGGHAAGRRLRDYADFVEPASSRNALLVECGQHWEAKAPNVARESALRFLAHFDAVDPGIITEYRDPSATPAQTVIEITTVVTIRSDRFRFVAPVTGLQRFPFAGTVLALDGDDPVLTPHDDAILIMPTRRPRRGETAVRIGRVIA